MDEIDEIIKKSFNIIEECCRKINDSVENVKNTDLQLELMDIIGQTSIEDYKNEISHEKFLQDVSQYIEEANLKGNAENLKKKTYREDFLDVYFSELTGVRDQINYIPDNSEHLTSITNILEECFVNSVKLYGYYDFIDDKDTRIYTSTDYSKLEKHLQNLSTLSNNLLNIKDTYQNIYKVSEDFGNDPHAQFFCAKEEELVLEGIDSIRHIYNLKTLVKRDEYTGDTHNTDLIIGCNALVRDYIVYTKESCEDTVKAIEKFILADPNHASHKDLELIKEGYKINQEQLQKFINDKTIERRR